MKIVNSPIRLLISSNLLEYFFTIPSICAKSADFDYIRQEVEISKGKPLSKKIRIPFSSIDKIYHRIYGDLPYPDRPSDGSGAVGGISTTSIIFMDVQNLPNETILIDVFSDGGNSKKVRKAISRVQDIVDKICLFTGKPMVIECEELGFFVDLKTRKILFSGRSLKLADVSLIQVLETKEGHYSIEIFTKGGEAIVTTKGRDKTLYISDTARLVAEKAGLPFQKTDQKPKIYSVTPRNLENRRKRKNYLRDVGSFFRDDSAKVENTKQ